MSETKHTEGRLTVDFEHYPTMLYIENEDDKEIVEFICNTGESKANARHIAACWNACAGIPIEVLTAPEYSIKAELDTLDEERNRLHALRIKNEEELHSLRFRLAAIEQAATDVEAYIDGERVAVPDVYMECLRDELIRTRNALGILPEQDAVRPKEGHDVQYPGHLFDLDEIKKGSPAGPCRCIVHPVPEDEKS